MKRAPKQDNGSLALLYSQEAERGAIAELFNTPALDGTPEAASLIKADFFDRKFWTLLGAWRDGGRTIPGAVETLRKRGHLGKLCSEEDVMGITDPARGFSGGAPGMFEEYVATLKDFATRRQAERASCKEALPEAYYDQGRKIYWILNSRGGWIEITETAFRRHLKMAGISPTPRDGAIISPLDEALNVYQTRHDVSYAGSLAGFAKGIHEVCGNQILVTSSPRLIETKAGEFPIIEQFLVNLLGDQFYFVLGWWKVAVSMIRSGQYAPGQALVIAGPSGCGKSLLQNLITETLGGRCAKPYRYMSGATDFNGELFGAEHLMVEDEVASTDFRVRRNFGARIKEVAVNMTQSCHAKNRQAITLTPRWRLSVTLNDEPENLLILPPLDESLEDKVMLLKAEKKSMPMPTETEAQKQAFWSTLMAELPGFLHYLEQWQIPTKIRSERYGVAHYHHPDLLAAIDDLAPETRLLNLIDTILFGTPAPPSSWQGTADELEKRLVNSELGRETRALLSFTNAMGTFLGRLAKRHPDRVQKDDTRNQRAWIIKRL